MTVSVARPIEQRPQLGASAAGWPIPGAWREHGVHRGAARRRKALRRLIPVLILGVRTMLITARRHAWSVAWPAAFTGAGFTVNRTVGLVVLGFACLLMDLRTDDTTGG